jgi:uncharacterized protein HemX
MRPIKWLFWLALLGALAYGGWRGWLWGVAAWQGASAQEALVARLDTEVQALRQRSVELNRREAELALSAQKNGGELVALGSRMDASEQGLARLGDAVEGGRTRLQLASVEQLMLSAADRLQLSHDNSGALEALDLADQRLASLNDPRLFKVREALSKERAALAAAGVPDVTGLGLTLSELLRAAPKLPLQVHVPERFEAPEVPPATPEDGSALARIWAAVKTALSNVFALHRRQGPPPRLLPPEQQALVMQVLQLKLEGARLALLARDGRTMRELVDGAREWLELYYDLADPAVKAAMLQLDKLRAANLTPPAPELGRSLALLRGVLGTR